MSDEVQAEIREELAAAEAVRPETFEFAIRIRGLRNQFGDAVIHDNLDLDVRSGEILGVVGGSGTGKSVLLRSIVGLQIPAEGEIEVYGKTLDTIADILVGAVIKRSDASADTVTAVLRSLDGMGDFETSQVLKGIAQRHTLSGEARDLYIKTAERLGDFHQNEALAALVRQTR